MRSFLVRAVWLLVPVLAGLLTATGTSGRAAADEVYGPELERWVERGGRPGPAARAGLEEPPIAPWVPPARVPAFIPPGGADAPADDGVALDRDARALAEAALPDASAPLGPSVSLREIPWRLQVLPDGLIYRSYLAGVKEPRHAIVFNNDDRLGWIWDISLGGRVGMLRYGSEDTLLPDGWQIDFEGAALLRLDPEEDRDLVGTDYRFGIPLTFGRGPLRTKFSYYHVSSHMGDEFLIKNPGVPRENYVRDALVLGQSIYLTENLRLYAEAAWAFYDSGGARPWEFQFGMDYSPLVINGLRGAPFVALNGHLREEFDFGGNLVVQTGWQWRGPSGQLFRMGMQYYNGKSDQWEFFNMNEEKIGIGMWYDY